MSSTYQYTLQGDECYDHMHGHSCQKPIWHTPNQLTLISMLSIAMVTNLQKFTIMYGMSGKQAQQEYCGV